MIRPSTSLAPRAISSLLLALTAACGGAGEAETESLGGSAGAGASAGGALSTSGGVTSGGALSTSGGVTSGGALSTSGGVTSGGALSTSGGATSGGALSTSGGATSGGALSTSGGATSGGASSGGASSGGAAGETSTSEPFSFFVTSLEAVQRESGNQNGFGGDLGGLTGADEICTRIAESSMPGSGAKGWRAFLSTSSENAIERIGSGPWYDRLGRLVAENVAGLQSTRPAGDAAIVDDLPNETGTLNHAGTGTGDDDNHDTITGSDSMGMWDGGSTCQDWTSATGSDGPRVGHSWPANSGQGWIQTHTAPGCEPSVNLVQNGGGSGNGIGNGGGYGGFYCFALMP